MALIWSSQSDEDALISLDTLAAVEFQNRENLQLMIHDGMAKNAARRQRLGAVRARPDAAPLHEFAVDSLRFSALDIHEYARITGPSVAPR